MSAQPIDFESAAATANESGDGGFDAPFAPDESTANGSPYSNFRARQAQASEQPTTAPVSLADRARAMRERCPVVRLPTGLATLDKNCRGGLRLGSVVIIGGAPGVGKTALAVDLAHRWARAGIEVGFGASDEGPDDILMRIALHEGVDAALLELGDPAAWADLEARLADLPLHLFDGDGEGVTLEAVAAHMASVCGGARHVIFGDSVQTIRPAGPLDPEASPRARVDLVVRSAKRIARSGPLVVLTSELGRGAYKNRANAENVTPLAAFKESGGIEYGAQTALVLRSVPGGDGRVEVDVPKNRGGFKEGFFLEVDARTRVREVDALAETQPEERANGKVDADARQILVLVANTPGIGSRKLRERSNLGPTTIARALERLLADGRIENHPETRGQREDPHYFAVAVGEPEKGTP